MTTSAQGSLTNTSGVVAARWVFTDRLGGASAEPFSGLNLGSHVGDDPSAVQRNREALAGRLGLAPDRLVFMRPDHGRGVAVVGGSDGPVSGIHPDDELRDVDALVTRTLGVGLVALAADCVPCLLVDPDAGVAAAVHSGWRGVLVDVVGAAVEEMVGCGAVVGNITALLGPAICGECYAVPPERVAEVAAEHPSAASVARDGQPSLDLRRALTHRLESLGVMVDVLPGCPAEDVESFSHRRDGVTGRQSGAVVLVGRDG